MRHAMTQSAAEATRGLLALVTAALLFAIAGETASQAEVTLPPGNRGPAVERDRAGDRREHARHVPERGAALHVLHAGGGVRRGHLDRGPLPAVRSQDRRARRGVDRRRRRRGGIPDAHPLLPDADGSADALPRGGARPHTRRTRQERGNRRRRQGGGGEHPAVRRRRTPAGRHAHPLRAARLGGAGLLGADAAHVPPAPDALARGCAAVRDHQRRPILPGPPPALTAGSGSTSTRRCPSGTSSARTTCAPRSSRRGSGAACTTATRASKASRSDARWRTTSCGTPSSPPVRHLPQRGERRSGACSDHVRRPHPRTASRWATSGALRPPNRRSAKGR